MSVDQRDLLFTKTSRTKEMFKFQTNILSLH